MIWALFQAYSRLFSALRSSNSPRVVKQKFQVIWSGFEPWTLDMPAENHNHYTVGVCCREPCDVAAMNFDLCFKPSINSRDLSPFSSLFPPFFSIAFIKFSPRVVKQKFQVIWSGFEPWTLDMPAEYHNHYTMELCCRRSCDIAAMNFHKLLQYIVTPVCAHMPKENWWLCQGPAWKWDGLTAP